MNIMGLFDDDIFDTNEQETIISESLYNKCRPLNREELCQLIADTMLDKGNNCDLTFIDTSAITDMSGLFAWGHYVSCSNDHMIDLSKFNGDISLWDVSNVKNMHMMFNNNDAFKGDISSWDVSNVEIMEEMFAFSSYNGNISSWNIDKKKVNIYNMFAYADIEEVHKPMPMQQFTLKEIILKKIKSFFNNK